MDEHMGALKLQNYRKEIKAATVRQKMWYCAAQAVNLPFFFSKNFLAK